MSDDTLHDAVCATTDVELCRNALTSVIEFVRAVEHHEYADPLTIAATIRHKIYASLADE